MLTITIQNSKGQIAVLSFQLSFSTHFDFTKKLKCTFLGTNTNEKHHRNGDDQSAVSETLIVAGSEGVQKKLENVGPRWMSSCCYVAKMSYTSTRVWLIEVFSHLPRKLDSCHQRHCSERRRDCEDWLIV